MAGTRYVTSASIDIRLGAWRASLAAHSRARPLPDLGRAALLVVDVQRYFLDSASHAYLPALEAVLPRIEALITTFARAKRPVVFTRHVDDPAAPTLMQSWWRGSIDEGPMAELAPALADHQPDLCLKKASYSAFEQTELASWLRERGCESVVLAGGMTHLCVETSARHAFVLGFRPVVVADATAAHDEEHHLGALRNLAHGFAVSSSSGEVAEALDARNSGGAAPDIRPLPEKVALLVAGGGPAGIAAAIQAQRSGVEVLLCEPRDVGGQLRIAERVENYVGFPGGIGGAHLAQRMAAQLAAEGIRPYRRRVESVERAQRGWRVQLDNDQQVHANAVVDPTGACPRPFPQIPEDVATAYLHEGMALRGRRVAIVGGGEAAFDQALLAARLGARQVVLLARSKREILPRLEERAEDLDVERRVGVEVRAARAQGETILLDLAPGDERLEVDHLVVCVGKGPNLPDLPSSLARGVDGDVTLDEVGGTSEEGLYVVGDARRGRYRQALIAAGDGLAAAMAAVHWLAGRAGKGRA